MSVIVFDFDGTVADSFHVALSIYNEMAEQRGFRHVSETDIPTIQTMTIPQGLKFTGIRAYQVPGLLTSGKKEFEKRQAEIKLFKGMDDVIKELHKAGHELYILSTNSKKVVQQVLERFGLDTYVTVLGSAPVFGKASALRKLCRKLRIRTDEMWMIGDELRDAMASKKAGTKHIGVTWGLQTKDVIIKANPTAFADKPSDILRILSI